MGSFSGGTYGALTSNNKYMTTRTANVLGFSQKDKDAYEQHHLYKYSTLESFTVAARFYISMNFELMYEEYMNQRYKGDIQGRDLDKDLQEQHDSYTESLRDGYRALRKILTPTPTK